MTPRESIPKPQNPKTPKPRERKCVLIKLIDDSFDRFCSKSSLPHKRPLLNISEKTSISIMLLYLISWSFSRGSAWARSSIVL